MASRSARAAKWVAALLLVSAPALAAGEPSAADRENARAYMAEGRTKRDAGDLKAALRAFAAADEVMHVPTTAVEVARTEAMMGLLIEAHDHALQIARSQAKPGEPPPFQEARAAAQRLADDVEPRVPSIRVVLKNAPDGVTVRIDDATLPAHAVGLPRKLDPGAHVIVAKLGSTERKMTIQVLEREAKEVPIDWTAEASAPVTTVTSTSPALAPSGAVETDKPAASSSGGGPWLALGITGLGLGVASAVVGSVTGIMSISQTNDVKAQCTGNVCPPTLSDGRSTNAVLSTAHNLALVSTITFIGAGVLAAAGTVFVVIAATHKPKRLEVGVGLGSVSLSGGF